MRDNGVWPVVIVESVVAAAILVWACQGDVRSSIATPPSVLSPDSLLYIPLEQTAASRQEFLKAYRASDQKHARALYEKFLPRIGANGLRQSLEAASPTCHDEAHDLGKVIFARLRDVGASLESCADACASGCMHGVLMEFFTDTASSGGSAHEHQHSAQLTAADVADKIPTLCESKAMTRRYSPGDCAHGVGHAAMFLSKYEIPAGISLCDRFPSYALRYYCATGAYMEYRLVRNVSDLPVHGAFYPCDKAPYPAACFRYIRTSSIGMDDTPGGTFAKFVQHCEGLTGKFRLGCFHGIGNAHMGRIARGRRPIAEVCGVGTREDQTVCVEGAMERLGKFTPEIAARRCDSLTDWRREVCHAAASRKMYDMEKSFAMYQR